MSDAFDFFDQDTTPISLHVETEDFLDMFQLQTGLERAQAIEKIMGIGIFVYQLLLEASARGDGNPRMDFVVRDRNLSRAPISHTHGVTLQSLLRQ